MYIAYLCYPHSYDDEDVKPEIKFSEPREYSYAKIVVIQFSPLHRWTSKDDALYGDTV